MNKVVSLLVLAVVAACASNGEGSYDSFFGEPANNEVDMKVDSIIFEKIPLPEINTSYSGYSEIYDDKLFFADALFSYVYEFDRDGHLVGRHLGYGQSSNELPIKSIEGYAVSENGHHYFIGSTTDIYEFDSSFNKVNAYLFLNNKRESSNRYDKTDYYPTDYGNVNLVVREGKMYMNVDAGDDVSNITTNDYYTNARIIESRNSIDGTDPQYLGRLTPALKVMGAMQKDRFVVDEDGNFIVCYEPDSLMYVYGKNFKFRYSFGHAGKSMNTDYVTLVMSDNVYDDYLKEHEEKGWYSSVCKANGLVFRTYETGSPACQTRLQIYDGTTEIADVCAPRNFRVLGYIPPYYYSTFILDEDAETIELYKFRID